MADDHGKRSFHQAFVASDGNHSQQNTADYNTKHESGPIPKRTKGETGGEKKMTVAERMMLKMGYKGGGLGKEGQGIAAPVKSSNQISTLGLGFKSEIVKQEHTYKEEKFEIVLKPTWMPSDDSPSPQADEFESWMTTGPRSEELTDGSFCDIELQVHLFNKGLASLTRSLYMIIIGVSLES